ncbi:MAG TPA: acyl-CoA carboxylase epsilon subunit [Dermatophilaceae bacterium]|nr:acyl-CoA carboxylase epsilon subunit [Dermatophilaceae bacterium]
MTVLQVVRGTPTDEELAALVLALLAGPRPATQRPHSGWLASARAPRVTPEVPRAWRRG